MASVLIRINTFCLCLRKYGTKFFRGKHKSRRKISAGRVFRDKFFPRKILVPILNLDLDSFLQSPIPILVRKWRKIHAPQSRRPKQSWPRALAQKLVQYQRPLVRNIAPNTRLYYCRFVSQWSPMRFERTFYFHRMSYARKYTQYPLGEKMCPRGRKRRLWY